MAEGKGRRRHTAVAQRDDDPGVGVGRRGGEAEHVLEVYASTSNNVL